MKGVDRIDAIGGIIEVIEVDLEVFLKESFVAEGLVEQIDSLNPVSIGYFDWFLSADDHSIDGCLDKMGGTLVLV